MPISQMPRRFGTEIAQLALEVLPHFEDPNWSAWAERWTSGAERRSGSAIEASAAANVAIVRRRRVGAAHAAFAVADAAARALIYPEQAEAHVAWARRQVRAFLRERP
jgi:hypothetical protein